MEELRPFLKKLGKLVGVEVTPRLLVQKKAFPPKDGSFTTDRARLYLRWLAQNGLGVVYRSAKKPTVFKLHAQVELADDLKKLFE